MSMLSTLTLVAGSPIASRTASSVDADGGGPPILLILVLVVGAVWLVSFLARSEVPTVVVVQKEAGSFWGLALVGLALGIVWFWIAPGSGPS
jgi:hypothetical protein